MKSNPANNPKGIQPADDGNALNNLESATARSTAESNEETEPLTDESKSAACDPDAWEEASDCISLIEDVRRKDPECLNDMVHDLGIDVDAHFHSKTTPDDSPAASAAKQSVHNPAWSLDENPSQIGRFQILRKLGEGGFGLVLLAYDPDLAREVALKIPRVESLFSEETQWRFLQEGKAVARLSHPNIAAVYEAGQIGPVCYIVSAYCSGGSLAEFLRDEAQGAPQLHRKGTHNTAGYLSLARLIELLAKAVQHAHERGILHRDLKPSNILFDTHPALEQPSEQSEASQQKSSRSETWMDSARIVDFGLAKSLDAEDEHTLKGAALGTPSYMSPEQAAGARSLIGPTTDVYALGAILYELLTGTPPLKKASHLETLIAVKNETPVAPRQLNSGIPKDLEAICLMCLEKEPRRRYATAAALADDLQRYQSGASIRARTPSALLRVFRWGRRHPGAAALMALVLATAVIAPIVALSQRRLYRQAEQARDLARQMSYTSDMNLALRDWEEANVERCGELLQRHIPKDGSRDFRGFEWYYLRGLWQESAQIPVMQHFDQWVEALAVSPDDKLVAVGTDDGGIRLCDRATGRSIGHWKAHPYRTFRLAFSADGKQLASANIDNEVKIWDVATHHERIKLQGSRAVAFSPVDATLAYRTNNGSIAILDEGQSQPRIIGDAHSTGVGCVAFAPDGRSLASAGWAGRVRIWDVATGERRADSAGPHSIWRLAWSPDGEYIVTGDVIGKITLRDGNTAARLRSVDGHRATVRSLAFTDDSLTLASSSDDNLIKLWSVPDLAAIKCLRGHYGMVTSVAFAERGDRLLSSSIDGNVKSWDLSGHLSDDTLKHHNAALCVSFSADGTVLATGCADGIIRLWDSRTCRGLSEFHAHESGVWKVIFFEFDDRNSMMSMGADGRIRIWDVDTQEILRELKCYESPHNPVPLAYSSKNACIAYPDTEFSVTVWDLSADKLIYRWNLGNTTDLQFSPDGRSVALALHDTIDVRALRGDSIATLTGLKEVRSVAFSPTGSPLVAGLYDRTVRLWGGLTSAGKAASDLRILKGPAAPVLTVAYSNDGTVVASAGADNVIRLWDPETGEQRGVLTGHGAAVNCVQFSQDGRLLASAGNDFTVRIWRAPLATELTLNPKSD